MADPALGEASRVARTGYKARFQSPPCPKSCVEGAGTAETSRRRKPAQRRLKEPAAPMSPRDERRDDSALLWAFGSPAPVVYWRL